MKRMFFMLTGLALLTAITAAGDGLPAILHKVDGRAWRVILLGDGGDHVIMRLEKSTVATKEPLANIARLEISHPDYSETDVRQQFNQADFAAVIAALEPVAAPAALYMALPNDLQEPFSLLMKAWYHNGDSGPALAAARNLARNPDERLRLDAHVYGLLAALADGVPAEAEAFHLSIQDPAARIFGRACIERARGQPKKAIQSAVELIAGYPDDAQWMPLTEMMCAELYLEMGMTNSAAATARQTALLYKGTHIEKKAQALRSMVEPKAGPTDQ